MATPFEDTPKWFVEEYYLSAKLAQLQAQDPKGEWTRDKMNTAFVQNGCKNPYDHYLAYGDAEGLNPNPLFNADEYLAAKVASLGSTWTKEMVLQAIKDGGMTLAQHYVAYGSAEGINPSMSFDQDKYFDAKLEQLMATDPKSEWTLAKVKEAFAANGITPMEHYYIYGEAEGLHDPKYDYTVGGKPIPHPGNDITLTAGTDVVGPEAAEGFVTSGRDDTINATVSNVSSKNTLNPSDVIDGAGGRDVLKVDMQSNFTGFKDGGVKNVETIALNNASARTFSAKGVVGVEEYIVAGGEKGTTITNVDSAATTYTLSAEKGAAFKVQIVDSAVSGKEDNVTVNLNGVGDSSGSVSLDVSGSSTQAVESLTLNAATGTSFVKVVQDHADINVLGAGSINITADKGGVKNFDASLATGKVTADLSKAAALNTVDGGLGDDTITVGVLASGAVLNGGAGADTLKFGAATGTIKAAISGFETFDVNAATAGVVFNMTSVTDLETIKVSGKDATGGGVIELKNAGELSTLNFVVADEITNAGGLKYDGTGTLNVSVAATDNHDATGIGDITAGKISDMTVTGGAYTGEALTITKIVANSLTNLVIDTAEGGVTYSGTGSGLAALTGLNFKGDGAAEFTFASTSSASKLSTVDARELRGDLTLDLSNAKVEKGVTVDMGDGGASGGLTGTAKDDVFNLGNSAEMVFLASGAGVDQIFHFNGVEDRVALAASATIGASAAELYTTRKDFTASGVGGGNITFDDFTKYKDASGVLTSAFTTAFNAVSAFQAASNAAGASAGKLYFAFDNGNDIGIFVGVLASGGVSASAAISAGNFTSIELVGILKGTDLADIHDAFLM